MGGCKIGQSFCLHVLGDILVKNFSSSLLLPFYLPFSLSLFLPPPLFFAFLKVSFSIHGIFSLSSMDYNSWPALFFWMLTLSQISPAGAPSSWPLPCSFVLVLLSLGALCFLVEQDVSGSSQTVLNLCSVQPFREGARRKYFCVRGGI